MISIDEQIRYVLQYAGPTETAILASLRRLKAIEEADGRPEPVAWTTKLALDCKNAVLAFDVSGRNLWSGNGVPLCGPEALAYADHWRAKAEAAQVDAERYRWLRSVPLNGGKRDWLYMPHTEELDAAIDEARKANG